MKKQSAIGKILRDIHTSYVTGKPLDMRRHPAHVKTRVIDFGWMIHSDTGRWYGNLVRDCYQRLSTAELYEIFLDMVRDLGPEYVGGMIRTSDIWDSVLNVSADKANRRLDIMQYLERLDRNGYIVFQYAGDVWSITIIREGKINDHI